MTIQELAKKSIADKIWFDKKSSYDLMDENITKIWSHIYNTLNKRNFKQAKFQLKRKTPFEDWITLKVNYNSSTWTIYCYKIEWDNARRQKCLIKVNGNSI